MIGCFRFNIWIFSFSLYKIPKCFSYILAFGENLVNDPTWYSRHTSLNHPNILIWWQVVAKSLRTFALYQRKLVHMDWLYLDDLVEVSGRTNVVIAAYTTAQARLKLYGYLERLNTRTLYCDTDCNLFL